VYARLPYLHCHCRPKLEILTEWEHRSSLVILIQKGITVTKDGQDGGIRTDLAGEQQKVLQSGIVSTGHQDSRADTPGRTSYRITYHLTPRMSLFNTNAEIRFQAPFPRNMPHPSTEGLTCPYRQILQAVGMERAKRGNVPRAPWRATLLSSALPKCKTVF
jgi:hypothetical protein